MSAYPHDIFTPTPAQEQASMLFRWLLTNDPAASTIGIKALIRHQASRAERSAMTDDNTTTPEFIPYKERPALDKGERITWRELESGMLFEPGVMSDPRRRRVRGTPIEVDEDRSYIIGSEDIETGQGRGGIQGTGTDTYVRIYDDEGRPVYVVQF